MSLLSPARGQRKIRLGFFYLFGLLVLAAAYGPEHWTALAALATGLAAGVGVVIYGNVKVHESANSKEV